MIIIMIMTMMMMTLLLMMMMMMMMLPVAGVYDVPVIDKIVGNQSDI